ncbi:MAG TPA: rhomboid family intramembrane serine protease [Anaerolineales bacterium]|nr:rhomboid family intramembrane serine protease [Anaerolineales bacterium]
MFIPFYDTEPNRYGSFPFVTVGLIATNVAVFILELFWVARDPLLIYKFGSTPAIVLEGTGPAAVATITHMFLHGGFSHIFFNMLALWVFGRRVEDACGPLRFLFYYLLCGVGADILSTIVRSFLDPSIPGIGASGAIYGVMGAYLVLFPEGRIRTFLLVWVVPMWPKIRALWVVIVFVGLQLFSAYWTMTGQSDGRVNYFAHIGGFLGALFIHFFLRPEAFARYMSDVGV